MGDNPHENEPIRVVEPIVLDRDGHEISRPEYGPDGNEDPRVHVFRTGALSGWWLLPLAILIPVMLVTGFAVIGLFLIGIAAIWAVRTIAIALFRSGR